MVSVIIPSYNREKVIVRSVMSVLGQTYTDCEVIVVDDCSDDNTQSVVEAINSPRVRYHRLSENSGACAARNKGIELAQGEYIAFQDSDDEWHPDKLELQMKALSDNDADIVFCGFEKIFSDGYRVKIPQKAKQGFYSQRELIYDSKVSTQTILGKADAIRNVGFDNNMPRMQDYDFIIRASAMYSVYYLDMVLVDVYEQPDSITATKKQHGKRLEINRILLEKYSDLAKLYPEWEVKMLKTIAHSQLMTGEDASSTLSKVYSKEKSLTNLAKCLLNSMGLLRFVVKQIDRIKR